MGVQSKSVGLVGVPVTGAWDEAEGCRACGERPWNVRFRWEYTGEERYCQACLLEELAGQPGKTLLDFFPECQDITHRLIGEDGAPVGRPVRYRSVRAVYSVLTSRLR